MTSIIELHGGKLMVRTIHTTLPLPSWYTHLMPGDCVTSTEPYTLIHRTEQPALAIVKEVNASHACLYIATMRPCSFSPVITHSDVRVGDRLAIWLHNDGSVTVDRRFSPDEQWDAECLVHVYGRTLDRPPLPFTRHEPLYTRSGIVDQTHLDTFTIDPLHSVDFDDAISVDVDQNTIYVHIVDMAHASLADHEWKRLRERCFSVYLANERTEHLLDTHHASNDLSLIVGQPRSVITVEMRLKDGMVVSYDMYRAVIRVKTRYTYEEVGKHFCMNTASSSLMYLLALSRERSSDIHYHLYLPAVRFQVDAHGRIATCHIEEDDESHQVVATAMILTNVVVSQHLRMHQVAIPNRFHDTLRGVRPSESMIRTHHPQVDSFLMVKTYARAHYDIDQRGHFGLHVTDYVHFTSPMRRYADVVIHRVLAGDRFTHEDLEQEIDWINHRATLCKAIQSLYTTWKIARHVRHLPLPHQVWVTGVNRGGVLWYMPSFSLNGFAHVSTILPKQYWTFTTTSLQGKHHAIRVGNSYLVTHLDVDPITYAILVTIHIP
jgi:exoribonuclease R